MESEMVPALVSDDVEEKEIKSIDDLNEDQKDWWPDRTRTWSYVCTWNNYGPDTKGELYDGLDKGLISAIMLSEEEAPTTGTPHLQIFAQSGKVSRTATLHKKLGGYWQKAKGTVMQNYEYISKSRSQEVESIGLWFENEQGRRTDLEGVQAFMADGADMRQLARVNPMMIVKYYRGIEKLKGLLAEKPQQEEKQVFVYKGKPGSGKTRKAYENWPGLYAVPASQNTTWWSGYDKQDVVLFDDYCGELPFRMLLRILDRYPHEVPTGSGGSMVWLRAKIIIFTTNTHPVDWYRCEEHKAALMRRVKVVDFDEPSE